MIGGPCETCGNQYPIRRSFKEIWTCDRCGSGRGAEYKDANGDRLVWKDELNGKYNDCLGEVVRSKSHLQEILKRNNMMQKGDLQKNKDWMGRSAQHG